jgi:hypothetical protein
LTSGSCLEVGGGGANKGRGKRAAHPSLVQNEPRGVDFMAVITKFSRLRAPSSQNVEFPTLSERGVEIERRHGSTRVQIMLPCVAYMTHDGFCTFSNRSAPQARASGVIRHRQHGPSITYSTNHTLQPARQDAVLD